jgi:hypothetical protein
VRSHEIAATNAWILTTLPALLVAVMLVVLVPLALAAAGTPRWLRRAAWPAGAIAALGLVLVEEPGLLAIASVIPYAGVAVIAGVIGVGRLLARRGPASRIAVATGLVFLPAAATWLVAYRGGHPLLGYPSFWVVLTAAHFHTAGVVLLIIVGRAAHQRGRVAAAIAIACVVSVPLTAAGIYGPRWLEVGAALGMATSAFAAGILLVTTRQTGLRIAGAILLISMPLAAAFALRDHGTAFSIAGLDPLGSMMITHGMLNVLAFALTALVVMSRTAIPRILVDAPPMSHIAGGVTIGAGFLARRDLEREPTPAPRGLVDHIGDLGHEGLDATRVSPAIRAFYERTGDHEMIVVPAWTLGFRTGARLWGWVARKIGQLQLPVRTGTEPRGHEGITSRIVAVDASADSRTAPRSWIRTFPDGRALYVAIYSAHQADDRAYMNIAFPLPGGNLTSILRMDHLGGGVSVSTRRGGDCGIWLVPRMFGVAVPILTPMSEEVDVWDLDDPQVSDELRRWAAGYTTVARHTLWLFGVRYLTLSYAMRLRAREPVAIEPVTQLA